MLNQAEDDLYSDDSSPDMPAGEGEASSATDGYFQPSPGESPLSAGESSPGGPQAPSHEVPHVPNVMVEDPTLSAARDAKEAAAQQDVNQETTITENFMAEEAPHSNHVQPLVGDFNRVQHSERGRSDGANSSNSTVSFAPQTPSLHTLQNTSPTSRSRYGHSRTMLPAQPMGAPPAYSSRRPDHYGTLGSSAREIMLHNSVAETRSLHSESEPLLPSLTPPINDNRENRPYEPANKSLFSSRRFRLYICLGIVLSSTFSSLVTLGIIFYPTAPKTETIDAEPIRDPSAEPPLSWEPPGQWGCRSTPHTIGPTSYEFSLDRESSINIVEEGWNNDSGPAEGTPVKMFGDIVVRSSRSLLSPQVFIDGFSNHPDIGLRLNIRSGHLTQTYYLTGPPPFREWPDKHSSPCYQGRITLWLPAGVTYRSSALVSEHFNLILRSGLNITALSAFTATLDRGDIVAPRVANATEEPMAPYRLQSPDFSMISAQGKLQGWFPLYNRLHLQSRSGDVTAQIGLKSFDLLEDLSAQLEVSSRSGNVNLTAVPPQKNKFGKIDGEFPLRDHATVVHTRTGNITADLPMGSRTEFETVSGNTEVDLQPILARQSTKWNRNPWLDTLSESGSTRIRVREPIWTDAIKFPEDGYLIQTHLASADLYERASSWCRRYFTSVPMALIESNDASDWERNNDKTGSVVNTELWGNFEARHVSSGGTLLITYPDSWTGLINWQGTSATLVSIIGSRVKVIRQWGSTVKHIEARRGAGRSIANIDTQSGIAVLAIGEEIP